MDGDFGWFSSCCKIVTIQAMNGEMERNFENKLIMMKNGFLCLAMLFLFSCGNQEPEALTIPSKTVQLTDTVIVNAESKLFISGMTCVMGCKGAIEKKLNTTGGIAFFDITFEDSTAFVSFDSTLISNDDILAAVAGVAGGGFYEAVLLNE